MSILAIRSAYLTFHGDPFLFPIDEVMTIETDGIVVLEGNKIIDIGPASEVKTRLNDDTQIETYTNCIVMPGFIDSHVHYPQTQMIAAYGEQLLEWLNTYTFPVEQQFGNKEYARKIADFFLREQLRSGTTTVASYCTVHPESVDAFFEASLHFNMRNIAGKVMMDRNAPETLTDTPLSSYEQSKALIEKWDGKERLHYAVTPRFAPSCSAEQLEMAGSLLNEKPGLFMQTHLSENRSEIEWVKSLYPERKGYLDVYDHYGLVRKRALFGHCVHLTEDEHNRLYEAKAAITHCPTSNFFLGSGFLNIHHAKLAQRPNLVGMATDLGAGTSFSALATLNEAYKAAQLNGNALSSAQAFYLATRGTAEAMHLQDTIGSLESGMEADLVVLDFNATDLLKFRMQYAESMLEKLFILMILGDDRVTKATYVAGRKVYQRDTECTSGRFLV